MSALADRIKIARGGMGDDINLSIQYILNCGGGVAGSCWGGSSSGVRIINHACLDAKGVLSLLTVYPYIALVILRRPNLLF